MFTGIVEETGVVQTISQAAESIRLRLECRKCGVETKIGESIAVNGCCLTVVDLCKKQGGFEFTFDLLKETWVRTNLQFLASGDLVNLERALRMNDRLGGHFVTGHVEGMGVVSSFEKQGEDYYLKLEADLSLTRYGLRKGSFTVDGISLTVAEAARDFLSFWIIPHTREVTNLTRRKPGDRVNLEPDLIGKYVERFTALRGP